MADMKDVEEREKLYGPEPWPDNSAWVAQMADIAHRHTFKPCLGEPCDLGAACKRHRRTVSIAYRYHRRFYK